MPVDRAGDLAARLSCWVRDEVHFHPQGRHVNTRLPTPEDLRGICRGQLVDIWSFVLDRIYSVQTVRKVQGNLALKSRQSSSGYKVKFGSEEKYSEAKSNLLERRKQLTAELTSTLTSIGHVERDLERLRQEIVSNEQSIHKVLEAKHHFHRKSALLMAHSKQTQEEIDKYKELAQALGTKTQNLSHLAKKSGEDAQYFNKQGDHKGSRWGLETACSKQVREACEVIGSFLHDLLQGAFNGNKQLMDRQKEQLWQKLEMVSREHPAAQVLLSLLLNTQGSALQLRDRTSNVNIQRDAEKLRFKYESGGQLQDTSVAPSVLHSVHQLLVESQSNHLRQFLATEKSLNQTWKLQQRLQEATALVQQMLMRQHRGNPGALELAKNLYDIEIQTAANRAALRTLEEVASDLRDKINRAAREKEILYSKYQKIQDFRKLTDSKQNLIRVLVKQNANSRNRLESQQNEILHYVQSSMDSHEAEARELSTQLRNSVTSEVDTFAKLALPYLLFTMTEGANKTAVIDLSINRLQNSSLSNQGRVLHQVLQDLEFPLYKAPECLLPRVMELLTEIAEMERVLQAHESLVQSLEGSTSEHGSIVDKITDLCGQVCERDHEQLQKVLPVLQKRIIQGTQALTECLQLRDTAQAWWEQPAQNTVPWIQVDDLSLQQWHDKWTVAVTRLRQHQMLA